MANVTRTTVWIDNQKLTASALNGEFNNLLNALNLTNSDISGGAGIVFSKLDSGTVAGVTATQTLTNKILSNPTINGSTQSVQTYSPGSGGTATLDLANYSIHLVTMPAGNITIALSGDATGKVFAVRITQDSGGSRTVSWFSGITWRGTGGLAPTLTTTGSGVDWIGFIETSSGAYDGFVISQA